MRKKEPALVVSFDTTTEAMKMEKFCQEKGLFGRLIPIPREITAGCGLAWKGTPEDKEVLEKEMIKGKIRFAQIYVLVI